VGRSPQTTLEATAIRQRMEEVRCDLDNDVQEIVEDAREMTDWHSYVKSHPWICFGAALAAGYLVVPPRPSKLQLDFQAAASSADHSVLKKSHVAESDDVRCRLLAFVGNLVMRELTSYAMQQAQKLLTPPDKQP
jgi:hypothetical protein